MTNLKNKNNLSLIKSKKLDFSGGRSLSAIWTNKDLEPTSKLILLSIANECNFNGAFLEGVSSSFRILCQRTSCSKATVITHIKKLQEQGYLEIKSVSHTERHYFLTEKVFLDYERYLVSERRISEAAAKSKRTEGGRSLNAIWNRTDISPTQKFVNLWLGAMCDYHKGDRGFLEEKQHNHKVMSSQISLSSNSLTRAIKVLEQKGYVMVKRQFETANRYRLTEYLFQTPTNNVKNPEKIDDYSPQENFDNTSHDTHSRDDRKKEKDQNKASWRSRSLENEAHGIFRYVTEASKKAFSSISEEKVKANLFLGEFGIEVLRNLSKLCFKEDVHLQSEETMKLYCRKIRDGINPFDEAREQEEKERIAKESREKGVILDLLIEEFGFEVVKTLVKICPNEEDLDFFSLDTFRLYCKKVRDGINPFEEAKEQERIAEVMRAKEKEEIVIFNNNQ